MRARRLHPVVVPAVLALVAALIATHFKLLASVDSQITQWIGHLPRGWIDFMLGLSFVGFYPFVIAVALLWAAFEYLQGFRVRSVLAIASLISLPVFYVIKELVRRARPVTQFVVTHGLHDFSFPSGHTTGSTAVYGTVFYLISRRLKGTARIMVILFGSLLIFFIGISRIFLGAHYPTDVLGGWIIGVVVFSLITWAGAWREAKRAAGTDVEINGQAE